MAKKSYLVASEEGAAYAQTAPDQPVEVGQTVELDIDEGTELALICAGWVEPDKTTKSKKEGEK